MNFKLLASLLCSLLVMTGCAAQNGWTPVVDMSTSPAAGGYGGYGAPPAQPSYGAPPAPSSYQAPPSRPAYGRNYNQDLMECKMLAQRVSGYTPQKAIEGGLLGGALGAAAGAAIGAVTGSPGKGAAIGAAAGGIGGGAYNAVEAERKYKQAYINCMRSRGWNVINP